jgi:hypothetical protein
MEPRHSFKTDLIDKMVKSVMNNRLADEIAYDDTKAAKLCGDIASEIRRRVKKLNFNRYSNQVVKFPLNTHIHIHTYLFIYQEGSSLIDIRVTCKIVQIFPRFSIFC